MATDTDVHPKATRRIRLTFDENGDPVGTTVCGPVDDQTRGVIVKPKTMTIPVIFVPGIMGSNLQSNPSEEKRAKGEKPKPVWMPPNGLFPGLGEWLRRLFQSNKTRQFELTADRCEVCRDGQIAIPKSTYTLDDKEARKRGWGEVHHDSYAKFLASMEEILNDRYIDCGTVNADIMKEWAKAKVFTTHETLSKTKKASKEGQEVEMQDDAPGDEAQTWENINGSDRGPFTNLGDDEADKAGNYYFPVWACGYNWLQSNEQSADTLIKRINEVFAHYAKSKYFKPVGKVIIVTHSMGGFVARRAAQKLEASGEGHKLLGIIHGEMPVGGAPVVYRRFRAGTESMPFEWMDLLNVPQLAPYLNDSATSVVLGSNAEAITCVMGSSPGPLELLPTKHYPPGWLRFQKKENGKLVDLAPALPKGNDPYAEIYSTTVNTKNPDKSANPDAVWWGMVDQNLIDIANLSTQNKTTPAKMFKQAIGDAEKFHDKLGLYFFNPSYTHYGADHRQVSFGAIHWITEDKVSSALKAQLMSLKTDKGAYDKYGSSHVKIENEKAGFKLRGKEMSNLNLHEDAGDATVPYHSGKLVESGGNAVKSVIRITNIEHAAAYNSNEVKDIVTYYIGKLVGDADNGLPVEC